MSKMDGLSREQLEKMADGLSSVLLGFVDADTAERILREEGFETEELEAIGFDVEV